MLCSYGDFMFYYIHCPAWQISCNPAFVLQYKQRTIIIMSVETSTCHINCVHIYRRKAIYEQQSSRKVTGVYLICLYVLGCTIQIVCEHARVLTMAMPVGRRGCARYYAVFLHNFENVAYFYYNNILPQVTSSFVDGC